jgi:hypothetical protein
VTAVLARVAALEPGPLAVTSPVKAVIDDGAPVTCEYGSDKEDNVIRLLFEVAVMFEAVPVVFWFSVGMSATTIALGDTDPAEPSGDAKNKFADSEVPVTAKVPEVVIGEPDTVSQDGVVRPTLVTDPDPLTTAHEAVVPFVVRYFPDWPDWLGKMPMLNMLKFAEDKYPSWVESACVMETSLLFVFTSGEENW